MKEDLKQVQGISMISRMENTFKGSEYFEKYSHGFVVNAVPRGTGSGGNSLISSPIVAEWLYSRVSVFF
jgi:hypothetical protein